MAYPPDLPVASAENDTTQHDRHPDDHNLIAEALAAIFTSIGTDPAFAASTSTALGARLLKTSNLADIPSPAAALVNLGVIVGASPGNFVTLGGDGKIASSYLPSIALTSITAVANQAARLALSAEPGDFAVQADNGLTYALTASPASTNANWLAITVTPPVTSVNGHTGIVSLTYTDVGADASGAAAAVLTSSLQKSANLSDLGSASAARTNLALATIAATGSGADLASSSVTLAKITNIGAATILGNNTASAAAPIALSASQAKTLLAIANTDITGLGGAATLSVGTGAGTVAAGDDSRFGKLLTATRTSLTASGTAVANTVTILNAATAQNVTLPLAPANGTLICLENIGAGIWTILSGTDTVAGYASGIVPVNPATTILLCYDATTARWTDLANYTNNLVAGGLYAQKSLNLSDLGSASAARTNLGASRGLTFTAAKTANYTASDGEFVRFDIASASPGAYGITTPASPTAGMRFGVVMTSENTTNPHYVDIQPNTGVTINYGTTGAQTPRLIRKGDAVILTYDATSAVWMLESYVSSPGNWRSGIGGLSNVTGLAMTGFYRLDGKTLYMRWEVTAGTATSTSTCSLGLPGDLAVGVASTGAQAGGGYNAQSAWKATAGTGVIVLNGGAAITSGTSLVGNIGYAVLEIQ